jgi:carboxynorspermidine decarboxylase
MDEILARANTPKFSRDDDDLETPAFVFDVRSLLDATAAARSLADVSGCKLLYSIKALPLKEVLLLLEPHVDGFSTSSLYECMLSRSILKTDRLIHFTAPGFRPQDFDGIVTAADRIAFNSLQQWKAYRHHVPGTRCGLRVNPELSFVQDPRYAPCRPDSKLGIRLVDLQDAFAPKGSMPPLPSGIHMHANCESRDLQELASTIDWLEENVPFLLQHCKWVNLGGGYLLENARNIGCFNDAVARLRTRYGVEVLLEPGAGLVQRCGQMIASVVDLFQSGTSCIAVIDASVNHLPNVFSYQEFPIIHGATSPGAFKYTIVGPTCLAGDVFGTYEFDCPLSIGMRLTFNEVGAYTMVKSHMFNGFGLPTVYLRNIDQQMTLLRRYDYTDFETIYAGAERSDCK